MHEADPPQRPVFEDIRFQNLSWVLQRIGWVAVALIVTAAATGVLSHGALSHVVARQDGLSLTVGYERFQRMTVLYRFDITAQPGAGDQITLSFNKAFWDAYEIDAIQPQPVRSTSNDGAFELTFEVGDRSFSAVMWARPRIFGRIPAEIGTVRGVLTLPIIVFP